ncbi:MAG: hypothetical protein HRT45_05425 [Bdellovibrionales bacterium]|nr:hypothetical protein [Bdellovibrionales bacterium]
MRERSILRSQTSELNPKLAIEQLTAELQPLDSSFTILFVSPTYDSLELEKHIKELCGPKAVACTTAGEISALGYGQNSISGMSFSKDLFASTIVDIDEFQKLTDPHHLTELQNRVVETLKLHHNQIAEGRSFAILLVDGLSMKKEDVTDCISSFMPVDVPVIGGSAGDGLKFKQTQIFANDSFRCHRATIVMVTTSIPFQVFKSQHFLTSDKKIVITSADPGDRIVHEIDGMPAAEAYAKCLGVNLSDFGPNLYSKHPVLLNIAGESYVRSIQKVNDDQSLTFYCAIESCLLFECILRRLEVKNLSERERQDLIDLYTINHACGFHTYGEQFGGTHINQTLTSIAIGSEK